MPAVLDQELWFPSAESALTSVDVNGLVAVGGELSVDRLLLAYRSGIFPWTVNPVTWWSPDPRAIFEWDRFHVSRSLDRTLRRNVFQITIDQAFRDVIEGCAAPARGRKTTWITPEFVDSYSKLHLEGHAHSVECWRNGALAGGIYGVAAGGMFAGESMFHRDADASKVALYYLYRHLKDRGFELFDIQMLTPHTESLGAIEIPRSEYLKRLRIAVRMECVF
ncbi:MAG: leucyl/phenylalanyl-tRNA--protein transferase [Verrucomicrobia bacterium]|nr:leucyl/phenylalanyl-tRNA--protein transferase [Verrucomicrobiota bacterium]